MALFTRYIKTYPCSILCLLSIWILCLIPVPETPLSQVTMIDKWIHLMMYGGLCLIICIEYGLHHTAIDLRRIITHAFIVPALMGGVIEIAQATYTGGNRSGDMIDFVADTIGVVLGLAIGIPLARVLSRRNRD